MGEIRLRGRIWWVRYCREGRRYEESSGSAKHEDAKRLLRLKEGDIERGIPVTPRLGRLTFVEGVKMVIANYTADNRDTLQHVQRRIDKHLTPFFGNRRMGGITTDVVTDYAVTRQAAGASNAEINRELSVVKRAYSLAMKAGKLMLRPHIPMLKESAPRRGFFEPEQFEAVRKHLPAPLRPVATFGYLTGWRRSEVVGLEWRQVDWTAREIRLEPGETKNGDGRTYPFTAAMEDLLKEQRREHERLKKKGRMVPCVFHRNGVRIISFRDAWVTACKDAGVPGRLFHDLRRTAVRNLELNGVSRSAAMAMVGHKTEAIYRRYAIADSKVLRDAAAKIDQNAIGTISGTVTRSGASRGSKRTA